ncbi:MAG: tetratricopeptide repeat protein [Nitrospirae bacterium]|uniref:tetratricopeptide repeat protein n=1 Tax=Candidatus Magnetobacterium casense TaxID=1455061 RepID=UPI00069701DE|nr:tetratricopeptide repeat protein [Candidatus Magnetobacterium casensis]MBF0337706.1 tetratricopeptide repeat protein [Nitrospirota bacterium]
MSKNKAHKKKKAGNLEDTPDTNVSGADAPGKDALNVTDAIVLCLILAVVLVYVQMWRHDFINLDDPLYVLNNARVRGGLSLAGIQWAFTTTYGGNWHPLTWLSHMLDVNVHGLSPGGHHLTSLLLHATNSVLLFLLLQRMTGALWQSAFMAGVFAVHPMHVESVAWVAERKDVLSGLFWILALLAYVRYVQRPCTRGYVILSVLFVAGLMAKPMVVTLPVVLVLVDLWPLHRLRQKNLIALITEKLPLFAIAAISSLITIYAQQSVSAISSLSQVPLQLRLSNALVSYVRYAGKLLVPTGLSVIYPLENNLPPWLIAVSILILLVMSVAAIATIRRRPYLAMGWLWYMVTLLPVIGLVQVGAQGMADKYTYIPSIGLFVVVTMGVSEVILKYPRLTQQGVIRNAMLATCAVVVLLYGALAYRQVGYWRNAVSLFEQSERVTGANYLVYGNLGAALLDANRLDDAAETLKKAVALNPFMWDAYVNLGRALFHLNRMTEAADSFSRAIEIRADSHSAYNGLGAVMFSTGKKQEAIALFKKSLAINPDYEITKRNLTAALQGQDPSLIQP